MENLHNRSTGPMVALLQQVLKNQGYYKGEIDSVFDPGTYGAVIAFQQANGLMANGIAGTQTWNMLGPQIYGYKKYTVQPGDTLFGIARQFGADPAAVAAANPVKPEKLMSGQTIAVPTGAQVVFTALPYSYEIMEINLQGLRRRYPFLKIGAFGQSVSGRKLYAVVIGEGPVEVFYNASHHANEWITTTVLMRFIERFCAAYIHRASIFGHSVRDICRTHTIVIAPMINPDGVNLVTGATKPGDDEYARAQALSRQDIPFPQGWKANIRGVDLNLNYPAGWETASAVKSTLLGVSSPGPRDYVGPHPLSEPECAAVAAFTRRHDFKLVLAYHTQGETIYWKYNGYNPAGSLAIAKEFSRAGGYSVDETPQESGNAGYKDWFIQEYNRPGYTIEAGKGINPLPLSRFPKIYNDNEGILILGATHK